MALRFEGIVRPPQDLIDSVGALSPRNPFNNPPYAAAQQQVEHDVVALMLRDGVSIVAGCLGYMGGRPLARTLAVPSAPDLPEGMPDVSPAYWRDLMTFCHASGIVQLDVGSYGTEWLELPHLPEQSSRRPRQEYVLDLEGSLPKLSSNHRRNVNRSQKLGVQVRRTRDSSALVDHVRLMSASMERREERGESVPSVHPDPFDSALLTCGAAELFQAHDGTSVLSSILVLRAPLGAYYQSAGTSPDGMELGASQFLISSVAAILQDEGMHLFNLGGAGDESPGLQRFKSGFGARAVPLEAATFVFGSRGERAARSLVAKALGVASLPLRRLRSPNPA